MKKELKENLDKFIEKNNILENKEYLEGLSPERNLSIFQDWIAFRDVRHFLPEERDYVQDKIGITKLNKIIIEYRKFMDTLPHVKRPKEKKEARQEISKRKDSKKDKPSWKKNK